MALSEREIDALRGLDTCSVANAIEVFNLRLRNVGYTLGSIHCRLPQAPPLVGYAVTAKMRCSSPPLERHAYVDRTEWWDYILTIPPPRVVVIQDVDDTAPASGSFIGEVHAHILRSLGCAGVVTDGAVRDLDRIERLAAERGGFQVFSKSVTASHGFAHLVEIGGPVSIGGLAIRPGMLLHGDRHGVVHIPTEIAAQVPRVAARTRANEAALIDACQAADFSVDRLRELLDSGHPDERIIPDQASP